MRENNTNITSARFYTYYFTIECKWGKWWRWWARWWWKKWWDHITHSRGSLLESRGINATANYSSPLYLPMNFKSDVHVWAIAIVIRKFWFLVVILISTICMIVQAVGKCKGVKGNQQFLACMNDAMHKKSNFNWSHLKISYILAAYAMNGGENLLSKSEFWVDGVW